MEYLFFIIYVIVVTEWIFSKPSSQNSTMLRGYTYYKASGLLNLIVGFVGMFLIDNFLRDKNIIPVWSVWVGIIGCVLFVIMGMYHIYRAMTTLRP